MKILLVSSSILPLTGGSSVIVEQLAQNFSKDEMMVLGARGPGPNGAPVRDNNGPEFRYFFSELSFMGRGARYFNWFRQWKVKSLVEEIKKLISREGITHVVGVYPNPYYCIAACRAAKSLDLPFSSYFHNTYIENTAITDPQAEDWQNEIFENSDHIFVMSKGMQDFYEEKYRLGKFSPLVHTFKEYPDQNGLSGIPGETKNTYSLVAIGNFNESNLEASRRFLNVIKNSPKYELSIYTHVPKILMEKRGMDTSAFRHMGAVPPEKVHEVIQDYDLCVLTHGFSGGYGPVEYQTIFPTRTIPLLLSGKPIIAHSPKGSFLNAFLETYDCAALVDEADEGALERMLEKVTGSASYQQELVEKARKTADQFYGPNVSNYLKSQLSNRP